MTSIFSSRPIISRKRWTAGERSSLLTVARRSRNSSSRSCSDLAFGLDEAVLRRARRPAIFLAMPNATSSRTQFSTSSRMRPNVCISASTSKVSSGRAHMKRRIAARSGDCTSAWNFAVTSAGSAAARGGCRRCHRRGLGWPRVVLRDWYSLIRRFISTASRFRCPWQRTGSDAAARLDHDVREEQVRVDVHRRDVRHVDRVLAPADPLRRVLHDARRRNRHLRRKQVVAAAPAAGPKHVLARHPAAAHRDHAAEQRQRRRRRRPTSQSSSECVSVVIQSDARAYSRSAGRRACQGSYRQR